MPEIADQRDRADAKQDEAGGLGDGDKAVRQRIGFLSADADRAALLPNLDGVSIVRIEARDVEVLHVIDRLMLELSGVWLLSVTSYRNKSRLLMLDWPDCRSHTSVAVSVYDGIGVEVDTLTK